MSASDLAEYAYCPRAHWYRHHPPPEGPTASSRGARREGERHHARALAARARWERWSSAGWVLLLLGGLLLLGAYMAGVRP